MLAIIYFCQAYSQRAKDTPHTTHCGSHSHRNDVMGALPQGCTMLRSLNTCEFSTTCQAHQRYRHTSGRNRI